jgi:DNA repair protein RadA/Sms
MPTVPAEAVTPTTSGLAELDRVLGGGLVGGAVLLLAGEPGVGKSTILLEVAAATARRGKRALYVSGEESASQVRMRAERTGAVEPMLYLAAETDVEAVLGCVEEVEPELLVVDSVQALCCADVDGACGGVTQVRAVTERLVAVAKSRHLPVLLVGHVTKDGSVAGPRTLEHIVDVVLQLEGERSSSLRLLRAGKNRFGPVEEVGCFQLTDRGVVEVPDPSGLFLSRHLEPISGTCITATLDGRRPLLVEVQALVSPSSATPSRRAVSGLDAARLAMLLAVLQRRVRLRLQACDIYASTVGGASVRSPGVDLAVAVALASAANDKAVPVGTVCFGEVGLAGELRQVPGAESRLSEAARLGFTTAIVPADARCTPHVVQATSGLQVVPCPDLRAALRFLGLLESPPASAPAFDLQVVG